MKLIFCSECGDIVKGVKGIERKCLCGDSSIWIDHNGVQAMYSGDNCVPLSINNDSFTSAIVKNWKDGSVNLFEAFTVHDPCKTFFKKIVIEEKNK